MTLPGVDASWIKNQIDSVRHIIGRNITVYYPEQSACLECVASGYYDPISDDSYNVVCPQCHGSFWLNQMTSVEVLARVHWVSNEGITATPGGKYFLGDAHITIATEDTDTLRLANNDAGKVVVDGQDMQINKIIPMGAPSINRTRVILKGMGGRPNE